MTKLGVNIDHIATIRQARHALEPDPVAAAVIAEMAPTPEMVRIALRFRPDQVTFVPEKPGEVTTEGGLDILKNRKAAASAIRELQKGRLEISLFIDPDLAQVDAAAELRVPMIELNTRSYAEACPRSPDLDRATVQRELNKITAASDRGAGLGLKILAGHGLTYRNVPLISDIADIVELNIGHNIVARAALVGMARAVKEMLQAMGRH